MKRALTLTLLGTLLPYPVIADEAAPATNAAATVQVGPRWTPCQAEADKFCVNADRGKGWVRNCLKDHMAELSPACKAVVDDKPAEAH